MTVTEPVRRTFETGTSADGVVYVVEPVTVAPDGAGGSGGVHAYARVGPITTTAGPCGMTGDWTLTPVGWRGSVAARVGDLVEWSPAIVLGGGPAVLDLAAVIGGTAVRYASTGTGTPAERGHAGLFSQGDPGTTRLPALKWFVREGDLASGTLTLSLVYRAASTGDTLVLGDPEAPSTVDITNLGAVGTGNGEGGSGGGTSSDAVTWADVTEGTPGAPPPTDVVTGTVPPERIAGAAMFTGSGDPDDQPADSEVTRTAITGDLYVDVVAPALWHLAADGWDRTASLRRETTLWLGTGDPTVDLSGYHMARDVAIDVATLDIYEL